MAMLALLLPDDVCLYWDFCAMQRWFLRNHHSIAHSSFSELRYHPPDMSSHAPGSAWDKYGSGWAAGCYPSLEDGRHRGTCGCLSWMDHLYEPEQAEASFGHPSYPDAMPNCSCPPLLRGWCRASPSGPQKGRLPWATVYITSTLL